ncbi:MAG: TlpA family protein disulfide reductase [Agriterribacter sp.]
MKSFFCLLVILCSFFCKAQHNAATESLHIGDHFPAISFSSVINHPVSKIQYTDYNSKLLILDFWATWCSSCITQFPKISSLSAEFADKVQFMLVPHGNSPSDSLKAVRFFLSRSAAYRLPSLTRDSLLSALFPHQSIPHYAWINNGTVIAVTDAAAVTRQNILSALNNIPMSTHEKKDIRYDPDSSLTGITGLPLQSSFTLSGYLEGFLTLSGYSEKSGLIKHYAINSPLLSLYSMAFPELGFLPPNRIIWNISNVSNVVPDNASWDSWKREHSYCFEFSAPAGLYRQIPTMIKSTLDSYFSYSTGFENRDMPCLVLSADNKFKRIPRAQRALVNTLEEKGMEKQLYGTSQLFADWLDRQLPIPVINAIQGELLDISLPDEPVSIEKLRSWLAPYGLELLSTTKNMRIFLVTDNR